MAQTFSGRAQAAQPALIDGAAGLVWAPGGKARVVFAMTIRNDKIVAIEMLADAEHLSALNLVLFDG